MTDLVLNNLEPVYNKNSKILILGTMPSPKSREIGFYYSHPQNRFWRVMSKIYSQPLPITNLEKKNFILKNNLALWDVLKSCNIKNADDNSITSPVPNDFSVLFKNTSITKIFTTGKKATELYTKYCVSEKFPTLPTYLSSTSPANRRISFEDLVSEYKCKLL